MDPEDFEHERTTPREAWGYIRLWWRWLVQWIPGAPQEWCPKCGSLNRKTAWSRPVKEEQTPRENERGIETVVYRRWYLCRDCGNRWQVDDWEGTVPEGRPVWELEGRSYTRWEKLRGRLNAYARSHPWFKRLCYVTGVPLILLAVGMALGFVTGVGRVAFQVVVESLIE